MGSSARYEQHRHGYPFGSRARKLVRRVPPGVDHAKEGPEDVSNFEIGPVVVWDGFSNWLCKFGEKGLGW
eukprot:1145503-Pelagomonas_calceolata.AAC.3